MAASVRGLPKASRQPSNPKRQFSLGEAALKLLMMINRTGVSVRAAMIAHNPNPAQIREGCRQTARLGAAMITSAILGSSRDRRQAKPGRRRVHGAASRLRARIPCQSLQRQLVAITEIDDI